MRSQPRRSRAPRRAPKPPTPAERSPTTAIGRSARTPRAQFSSRLRLNPDAPTAHPRSQPRTRFASRACSVRRPKSAKSRRAPKSWPHTPLGSKQSRAPAMAAFGPDRPHSHHINAISCTHAPRTDLIFIHLPRAYDFFAHMRWPWPRNTPKCAKEENWQHPRRARSPPSNPHRANAIACSTSLTPPVFAAPH